jgi:Zn-dependent protease with chaperone function
MNSLVQKGIAALNAGDKPQARKLFELAIQQDGKDSQALWWLSQAAETDKERRQLLQGVITPDPKNEPSEQHLASGSGQFQPVAPIKLSSRPSLAGRAFMAVLLLVGFYVLALGIAGALLYAVYAQLAYFDQINLRILLLCVFGAFAIIWSILPRFNRFVAPGPRLLPEQNPALFEMIGSLSELLKQKMPAEVYLIPDVNAYVGERGGFLGIGSRRIMGIGLPLLQSLTIRQLRGVLAHEFGHYYGGDTSLGPWIFKTRAAIIRTVANLGKSIVQLPFRWYAGLYLRVTQAISRRQELVADELAVRLVGSQIYIEALSAIHGLGPAYNAYWKNEVAPVLSAGYRPPLAQGFASFTSSNRVSEAMANIIAEQRTKAETNVYDSHPTLKDRISAVQGLPAGPKTGLDQPAVELIRNVPELEQKLLEMVYGRKKVNDLKQVTWQDVGAAVCLPAWTDNLKHYAPALKGFTPALLAELVKDPQPVLALLVQQPGRPYTDENRQQHAYSILGLALAVCLGQAGWQVQALPGQEVQLSQAENEVRPFEVVKRLASGELQTSDWQTDCLKMGIADLPLHLLT